MKYSFKCSFWKNSNKFNKDLLIIIGLAQYKAKSIEAIKLGNHTFDFSLSHFDFLEKISYRILELKNVQSNFNNETKQVFLYQLWFWLLKTFHCILNASKISLNLDLEWNGN